MIQLESLDKSQLQEVMLHYKRFYLPLGIIIICALLVFWFIIPQLHQYIDQKDTVEEVENRIAILENNISILSGINEQDQASQLAVVLAALPDDKDCAGILFAVQNASSRSSVGLGDFSFQVGELSSKSIIKAALPTIRIKLSVIGEPKNMQNFLLELSEELPLSTVTEIKMNSKSADILAEFYYKPIPQLKVNYAQPLTIITAEKKATLEKLQKWRSTQPAFDLLPSSTASPGATPFGL